MIKIYKLIGDDPKLSVVGYFAKGIVHIGEKEISMKETDALDRFNRGYWKMG